MAADGTTGILTVSQDAEFTGAQPLGNGLNHLQSQLGAGSILFCGSLPGLFRFRFSVAAGSPFRFLAFAVQPDEDGQGPDLAGSEGKGDASERAAAGAENPGASQSPEGGKTGLGKAGLKGEEERSKGADEEIGHKRVFSLSPLL